MNAYQRRRWRRDAVEQAALFFPLVPKKSWKFVHQESNASGQVCTMKDDLSQPYGLIPVQPCECCCTS